MPNRNIEGGYRYKYQGQEKDPETGKEAFELRLWDSRIGRWLTTDPAGVGFSPYVGMVNNPISEVDPDGACPCSECPETCGDQVHQLDTVVIGNVTETVPSGSWGADAITTLGGFDYSYAGSPAQYQIDYPEFAGMNYQQMVSHFETNHGDRFAQDYARLEAEFEKQRQEELALHMMGAFRYYIMMNEVVALGGFKPTRYTAPRPRLQPVTSTSIKVTFGQNPNQIHHTFRHIEKAGLNRTDVMNAIKSNLKTQTIKPGVPNNISIKVNNQEIIYSAYQLDNGLINVGRIVIPK